MAAPCSSQPSENQFATHPGGPDPQAGNHCISPLRALYWLILNAQIENLVQNIYISSEYQGQNRKEPVAACNPAKRAWFRIGSG